MTNQKSEEMNAAQVSKEDATPIPNIDIDLDIEKCINFALQQNDVKTIKSIKLKNNSDIPIHNFELRLVCEPDFAMRWSQPIAALEAGKDLSLRNVDLLLSPKYLINLSERLRGVISLEVLVGGECIKRHDESIELLAYDEWSGLQSLPEILAAFVLPNHPDVQEVLNAASAILKEKTGDGGFSGYQSQNPNRAKATAAAIYDALLGYGLVYIVPPASFERNGQRIRTPEKILESKRGTCLDLSLLYASCLEQAGLNSLIVMIEGHAFCGVWLNGETFSNVAEDDNLRLRKRVDLNDVTVFETTCLTSGSIVDFNGAVIEAEQKLKEEELFQCVIDIRRARSSGIRPLPLRGSKEYDVLSREPIPATQGQKASPEPGTPTIFETRPEERKEPETAESRLDRWRQKLLDLTLRNRLLNFVQSKKTLPLLAHDLARLEDSLADGVTFQVKPRPSEFGESDPRDYDSYRNRTGKEGLPHYLEEELKAKRLHADLDQSALDNQILRIYREARLAQEESGASGLYIAIGFLKWYESKSSVKERYAPLLLVPVELERKSVLGGFRLYRGSDDSRVNTTLLEHLKNDFDVQINGLEPLPEDASGVDVPAVLDIFRRAVLEMDRWEVVEQVQLGFFSFSKFLMWRDLQERVDDLRKNSVVEHLINRPDRVYQDGAPFPDITRLDEEFAPENCFCPLDNDSSQLRAILAAANGRSFVLEGPPGTGKSQTIANMIANCLAIGKTVLFVSEKMAALNVVFGRLKRFDLDRFCLELHSNKARKHDVISQLGEALNCNAQQSPEEWKREAQRLAGLRQKLNAYVHALHKVHNNGLTVFQATSTLIGLREVPSLRLSWNNPNEHTRDTLDELRDSVDSLAAIGAACGELTENPWTAVKFHNWSVGWEQDIKFKIRRTADCLEGLHQLAAACGKPLGVPDEGLNFKKLSVLACTARFLVNPPVVSKALLLPDNWEGLLAKIDGWVEDGKRRDSLRNALETRYSEELLDGGHATLIVQWEKAKSSNPLFGWFRKRKLRSLLKQMAREGNTVDFESIDGDLEKAEELKLLRDKMEHVSEAARTVFGEHWNDGEADWEFIEKLVDWAKGFREASMRLASGDIDSLNDIRTSWARLLTDGREMLEQEADIGSSFTSFYQAWGTFINAKDTLSKSLDLDEEGAWGGKDSPEFLRSASILLERWSKNVDRLRDWCSWRKRRNQAIRLGLKPLVEQYEGGFLTHDILRASFDCGYYEWWLGVQIDSQDVLRGFSRVEHERNIDKFKETDKRYIQLTEQAIRAKLAQKVPVVVPNASDKSEVGILQRELRKKRRHTSIRKLIGRLPHLMPRLKPCMLMSPMSVAQYLEPGHPQFDVVIFDEASQIPTWDAVGAIARGKQTVIAGDPKQLPPTNFFMKVSDSDEEDVDAEGMVIEDLESILDDCSASLGRPLTLDWHYRSRHESLIHFSNHHYYQSRLLTFPSSQPKGMGVHWRYVADGIYDKGKSRTNRAEAEQVVDEIKLRVHEPKLCRFSIGVVTFSVAQQTLIEELLEEARSSDVEIDKHFADDAAEPIFVKNLENVQGDERDVIIFSICYGPDHLGRVSHNFGPINREGGDRRLNVAITRARRELLVFSSLRADQIDLRRTRAIGAEHLKRFLDYAERGPIAISEAATVHTNAEFDSPFEQEVHDGLTRYGWDVDFQVGCSGYRIDLAVKAPNAPGRYLIGIECDGANYHSAKTARDRDRLREDVLRGLGWEIIRVWSTDWWHNPKRELDRLNNALEKALDAYQGSTADANDTGTFEKVDIEAEELEVLVEEAQLYAKGPSTAQAQEDSPDIYVLEKLNRTIGSAPDFFEELAGTAIREDLERIVAVENPVSFMVACRRISTQWGIQRVTNRVQDRVRKELPKDICTLRDSGGIEFLWYGKLGPENYVKFRVPGDDPESNRKSDEIALEEYANGALHVLQRQIALPQEDLVKETARLFGFQRTGRALEKRIADAIQLLIDMGSAESDDNKIALVSDLESNN